MSNARGTISLLLLTGVLAAWAGNAAAPAWGQQRGPRAARSPQNHRPPPLHRFPGANLFQSLPEDEGPVTPAEQRQLESFLRKQAPAIYRSLRQLRRRDPDAFRARVQEAAPRLRQLRRIFNRNPELGRNIIRHSENLRRMHGARQAWRDEELDPQKRRRIHDAVRRMMAENLRIETAVLEDQAQEREQARDIRIDAEFERLMSAELDLAEEPQEVRELLGRLYAGQEGDDLERLEGELRRACSERVDRETAGLRTRATRLRASAVDEVDRRMRRFAGKNDQGVREFAAPKPGKDRKRDVRRGTNDGRKGNDKPKRGKPPPRRP